MRPREKERPWPRRAGSVRFDSYYKLQRWDARLSAWVDIQETYVSWGDARAAAAGEYRGDGRTRIMRITTAGRKPVEMV